MAIDGVFGDRQEVDRSPSCLDRLLLLPEAGKAEAEGGVQAEVVRRLPEQLLDPEALTLERPAGVRRAAEKGVGASQEQVPGDPREGGADRVDGGCEGAVERVLILPFVDLLPEPPVGRPRVG